MNVDVKILTKILANRLKFILPSIIHATQTAVYGRKIDQTIHMIQDLIDLANENDEQAAFIFLDQEKAFDRVNHDFLFKIMEHFGIGKGFITMDKNNIFKCYCHAKYKWLPHTSNSFKQRGTAGMPIKCSFVCFGNRSARNSA